MEESVEAEGDCDFVRSQKRVLQDIRLVDSNINRMSYRQLKSQKLSKKGKTTVIHHVVNNKTAKSLKSKGNSPKSITMKPTNPPTVAIGLQIEPINNPSLFTSGGQTNTLYSFRLTADKIPSGIKTVRFEWSPGLGATGSKSKRVSSGKASKIIRVSYTTPGDYILSASVYHGSTLLATTETKIHIFGTTLSITPRNLNNAVKNFPYSFTFKAKDIPLTVKNVRFTWSFGVGSPGTGISTNIPVINGEASYTATHAYNSKGSFGLVADVRDSSNNSILADSYASVTVGDSIEIIYQALYNCGNWINVQSGRQGLHIHVWDISSIPYGAVFDIKYQMFDYPDRLLVEYPINNIVLDTGWRGNIYYSGNPLYPGGVQGDGKGEETAIFSRIQKEYMKITVIGPFPNTGWEYQIRCRIL